MKIDEGLILPFRFYTDLEKQMRYRGCGRWDQSDIAHNEYLISYGCSLLPFQIRRAANPSTTKNLSIVNVNTDVETDLTSYVVSADWDIKTIGDYDYITYYGNNEILDGGNCVIDECLYYAKFNDGNFTWYSELFNVVQSGFTSENYRIWSSARGCYRTFDGTDLRITQE